jgi:hypothetical protein
MKESADEKSYPDVPEIAIVKPEEERPIKIIKRSEEELDGSENEADYEHMDTEFSDMDGDGNPDFDPAVGPGV